MASSFYLGKVTRCSTRGFVGAVRLPEAELPAFGTFCRVDAQQGQSTVVGVVYNISIDDDEFARQMASADALPVEELLDNQQNRQVPVEFACISVGYQREGKYFYNLPPQPPLTLASIQTLETQAMVEFTGQLDFIPLVLSEASIPADLLLAEILRSAAAARAESRRNTYLIEAGRMCARYLGGDLARLNLIIDRIRQ
ncbi:MAG: hypothetical protein JXA25_17155 [Anaerolineales bacterium]|nr:hypothetical protein [Anaerolineales bacterium]